MLAWLCRQLYYSGHILVLWTQLLLTLCLRPRPSKSSTSSSSSDSRSSDAKTTHTKKSYKYAFEGLCPSLHWYCLHTAISCTFFSVPTSKLHCVVFVTVTAASFAFSLAPFLWRLNITNPEALFYSVESSSVMYWSWELRPGVGFFNHIDLVIVREGLSK